MLKYFVSVLHKVNACQAKRCVRFFLLGNALIMSHEGDLVKSESEATHYLWGRPPNVGFSMQAGGFFLLTLSLNAVKLSVCRRAV